MIGMSLRDLGASVVVVVRSRCFQTAVEAVGGRGGSPKSIGLESPGLQDAIPDLCIVTEAL